MGDAKYEEEGIYINFDTIPSNLNKIIILCYNKDSNWKDITSLQYRVEAMGEDYKEDLKLENQNLNNLHLIKVCEFKRGQLDWYLSEGVEYYSGFELSDYLEQFGVIIDFEEEIVEEMVKQEETTEATETPVATPPSNNIFGIDEAPESLEGAIQQDVENVNNLENLDVSVKIENNENLDTNENVESKLEIENN